MSKTEKKNTLKIFREKTGVKVSEELLNMTREQGRMRAKITKALSSGPKTIPEIAREIGVSSQIVTWYVLTFVRYGVLEPVEQTEEGYWKYKISKK